MLFTSAAFAFLYLPVVVGVYFLLPAKCRRWGAAWLFAASVFFYGYWMPEYVVLLLGSIVWNYWVGLRIATHGAGTAGGKTWLITGVTVNLALLAYYKYAGFLVASMAALLGADWPPVHIELPIGISFFTFTQIAFLADAYQKGTREYAFSHYGLFVTYFPHLVAGPVLHHAQMMPQFRDTSTHRFNSGNFVGGLIIFMIGLFKKVVLADGIAPYADEVFNAVQQGATPDTLEAWMAALAYTFQLYFDFSGYSDMAIGLSWMLNIRLPFNFDSPYKARSISEFWRRWHISLSNFLRDYLYIPLGGNRKGPSRRYVNLFITMLLGGLWHGAAWTFVVWGGLHGLYLAINHAFSAIVQRRAPRLSSLPAYRLLGWGLTFLSVVIAWVFFRAESFAAAFAMLRAMYAPTHGGDHGILWNSGLDVARGLSWCASLSLIAFVGPNSNRLGELALNVTRQHGNARSILAGSAFILACLLVLLNETRDAMSAFIYFNF
ncbi:MBOAT family O-acyltransferase [Nitrogeniibacter aestuarii]|uniref:MBOAT family O-acyltransferase n=1 Tax=Nitrogeniibacter aestuarii TaxID=2815343 RepID=UPI001E64132B|nr:MBOAT family protein [Nitrogeniibacter aestuarii]